MSEALKAFKKRHRLTNAELGRALGLAIHSGRNGQELCPVLSRWLSGKHKPPAMLELALKEIERQLENPAS